MQNWQQKKWNVHCNHRPQLAGFQSIIFFEDLFKRRYQDCQLIIITLSFSQTAQKIQLQLQRSFQKQTNILIYEKYMKIDIWIDTNKYMKKVSRVCVAKNVNYNSCQWILFLHKSQMFFSPQISNVISVQISIAFFLHITQIFFCRNLKFFFYTYINFLCRNLKWFFCEISYFSAQISNIFPAQISNVILYKS